MGITEGLDTSPEELRLSGANKWGSRHGQNAECRDGRW